MATLWITHPKKSKAPETVLHYLLEGGFDTHAADKSNSLTVSSPDCSAVMTAISLTPKDSGKVAVPSALITNLKKRLKHDPYISIVIEEGNTSSWNIGNYTEKGSKEYDTVIEAVSKVIKDVLNEDKISRIYGAINSGSKEGSTPEPPKEDVLRDDDEEEDKPKPKPTGLTKEFRHFDKLLQVMRKTVTISDTFFECTREERQEIVEALERLESK
jgi:phenylpyruvate tautomerase PptA (4-oxalocrotonate tautomerase family)